MCSHFNYSKISGDFRAFSGILGPTQKYHACLRISYAVLPQYQRCGLATEMVQTLVAWAGSQPSVKTILAETASDNVPSLRLLLRLGFTRIGPGVEPGHVRYGSKVAMNHEWCHVSMATLGTVGAGGGHSSGAEGGHSVSAQPNHPGGG